MSHKQTVIKDLFRSFNEIRYVAIYTHGELVYRQRAQAADASSSETDKYEELLVNPVLLTAARQRGNIDCGGLRFLLVAYGNFYQFIQETADGHISICLGKDTDLAIFPDKISHHLKAKYADTLPTTI